MTANTPPDYLVQQLKDGKGFSYREAVKFEETDTKDFVALEYDVLNLIHDEMAVDYKVLEQELVITKRNQVYDILLVKLCLKDGAETKFYFDITHVF